MWFLRFDTLIGIILICLVMMAINLAGSRVSPGKRMAVLVALCVVFIGWTDLKLLAFYLVYTMVIYGLTRLILITTKLKRWIFYAGGLFCLFPFVYLRLWGGEVLVVVGLAFALLRGLDALFFAYYSGESLRLSAFLGFMLFVPTFTAGPVFRYRDFLNSSKMPLRVGAADFAEAFKRAVRGAFKIVVAGKLLTQVINNYMGRAYTLPVSLLLIICSYLYLYTEMSGYADIAIGIGRLCGFIVPENFKKPWRAASFTQFWRCWHSTVSDWIREHVQIVLHKRRMDKVKAALSSMAVMLIMGLWHGFSLPYFFFSLVFGSLLAVENLFGLTSPGKKWGAVRVARCIAVNFVFGINTLVFMTDLNKVGEIVMGLFKL